MKPTIHRPHPGTRSTTGAPPQYDPPPTGTFSPAQKREVFKRMVVSELDAGFLRYSKREALMKYAAQAGISEFEASLLIAEAVYREKDLEPLAFDSAATLATLSHVEVWPIRIKLAVALLAAALIDLVLIYWILG